MNWFKKFLIKMAVKQLDQLKPIITRKVMEAQQVMNSIPPEQFANELINELEDAIFEKVGITKEER